MARRPSEPRRFDVDAGASGAGVGAGLQGATSEISRQTLIASNHAPRSSVCLGDRAELACKHRRLSSTPVLAGWRSDRVLATRAGPGSAAIEDGLPPTGSSETPASGQGMNVPVGRRYPSTGAPPVDGRPRRRTSQKTAPAAATPAGRPTAAGAASWTFTGMRRLHDPAVAQAGEERCMTRYTSRCWASSKIPGFVRAHRPAGW